MSSVAALPIAGVLRVVPPAAYERILQEQDKAKADAEKAAAQPQMIDLASYIRTKFQQFKNHRGNGASGWDERMLAALRVFNGQYSPTQLAEIAKFGGSQVYARVISMKCRGATSLLRDVYLSPDRSWGLDPPADPDIPPDILGSIQQLVNSELTGLQAAGQPVDPNMVRDRAQQLLQAARDAAKRQAAKRAKIAEDKLEEILEEGGFYKALAEFLVDLPLMPFACIKGPEVRIVPSVVWQNGRGVVQQKPKLFWRRVSPFDIWFTPGVSDIEDAEVIERSRLTRADLNDLLDLPGYNQAEIRAVLDEYGRGGIADDWDQTDSERAVYENRENPQFNQSGLISCLEYHGNVQGRMLLEYGMDAQKIPDPLRDYMVQAWLIGTHVIKVQFSPSPRKRHPYFITSFEKVPGTPVGNGLPDLLSDIQDVCNASLRALVNNLSIASGPQVVVNDERLAPGEDGEEIYPWKRWHIKSDFSSNTGGQKPIDFFQPNSNSAELLSVYNTFSQMADELSAIPKYLSGSGVGGAGRTASGLAMLMGNASKILQTVAANIDRDVFDPLLTQLYDMVMLTDTSGLLSGDETVRVMGVSVAIQRETQRSRQLEFLQITANPLDMQIMGLKGRAKVLRPVSQSIGLPGEDIVPSDEELEALQKATAMAQAAAQAQGAQPGQVSTNDMGPRTNSVTPSISGGVG